MKWFNGMTPRTRQILTVCLSIGLAWPGQWVHFAAQWPFYEGLRTTAGIVFAVIGAWITVLYPRGLEAVFDRNKLDSSSEVERVNALLEPLLYTTVVLIVILAAGPMSLVLKQWLHHAYEFRVARGIAFGLLTYLTLVQIWSLLLTLRPADSAQDKLGDAQYKKELTGRYLNRRQG